LKKDIQYNGQKFEDTKGVIRSLKLKKNRQYNGQKFEDSKGVIRSLKGIQAVRIEFFCLY
jgi:hypothetical protein